MPGTPMMVETVFDVLARLYRDGVTVLAVEQNVAITGYADLVVVLEQGRIDFAGPTAAIASRLERRVAATYLGRG